jgi:hypothetical protein
MADRPKMPVPAGEMTPKEICARIRKWAEAQGYVFDSRDAASEYAKIVILDPAGGHTNTGVHNAHHGRRLRKDQIRFIVRNLNDNWEG